ncbi:MAG: class I SAM-dependent methyltransferase [Spirochaetota bacterium]
MKLYNELAEYYYAIENENRNINDDIRMIQSLTKNIKNPSLLDLGCGTGEHLDLLSKLEFNCTGIDSSSEMYKISRSRFHNSFIFLNEDMRRFDFYEKFDIIISLFGSVDYLIKDSEINKLLQNTWKALKPDGIGIFEIWNAVPIRKIKEKPLTFISKIKYNDKIIKRERGFELLEFQTQTIVKVTYNYIFPGSRIVKDKHIMRAFTCNEIEHFMKKNEFQVIAMYSNSLLEPYRDISNKIILHFKKSNSKL